MSIRVHELARELKISSAALKKHLQDLGVEIRSAMSVLDEDITNKIRNKFNSQMAAVKKIENDRKKYYEQMKPLTPSVPSSAPVETEAVEHQEKPQPKPADAPLKLTRDDIPTHTEKPAVKPQEVPVQTQEKPVEQPQVAPTPKAEAPKPQATYPDKPQYERPERPQGERPQGDRPQYDRPQYDRPRSDRPQGDRPQYDRPQGDRPQGDRPQYNRPQGDRPQGDRPQYNRPQGDRPQGDRPQYNRPQGDRPQGDRPQYDRPRSDRPQGDRPQYDRPHGDRPQGDRPQYNRPQGDRPQGDRPQYNRPQGDRPQGDRPQYNRPQGDRPQRDRPQYNRPQGDRPQGDRPYAPRGDRPQGDRPYAPRGDRPQGDRPYTPRGGDKPGEFNKDRGSYRPPQRPYTPGGKPAGSAAGVKPEVVDPNEARKNLTFGKTKKTTDDLGDKSKHIQAKIKNTKKRKKKVEVVEIDEAEIAKNIKATMAAPKKRKRYRKEEKLSNVNIEGKVVISDFTSVAELAKIMDIPPTDIISKFFSMGQMVTINQRLDRETLEMISDEFGFDFAFQDEFGSDFIDQTSDKYDEVEEVERPPVVTIMGHVDHGKTSILDYIRSTNVIAGESGGITQHIGAYQVEYNGKKITFLDTPGHEAFAAMRARGANLTDIAVIVVAANEGVKVQTVEAIDHAKAAGVNLIIAINKIDLPEANLDKTIHGLGEKGIYLEGWGGDVLWNTCSAITGEGIKELMDSIVLFAEMKELTAKYDVPGQGIVIEAEKDSRMGAVTTILLQEGTMRKGDNIVCGATYGHVRRMENERRQEIKEIGPSDVAIIYGLSDVPKAGDVINVVDTDRIARQISSERLLIRQEREKFQSKTNLSNLFTKIKENQMNEVKLIIKADTDGSVEALCDSFQKLSTGEVAVNIIHKSVGGIIEADVNLAAASDAIIIGFHVRANTKAKKLSEELDVDIKIYAIIYDAINDIKLSLEGMLPPEIKEKYLGTALIKQVYKIKKIGTIAGCFVEKGTIKKQSKLRLYRNDVVIHEGEMASLKHYQNDVAEVRSGTDCGITIKDYNDIKENDVIEVFSLEEVKREL